MAKKHCRCLKEIDQTGIPVTLNWKKDNIHRTHCGGICTILAIFSLLTFVVGTFSEFLTFSQF